jgi:hypothetical protein
MKKLSKEEKELLTTRPMKRQGPVRTYLMGMKPGEVILIEAKEWTWASRAPSFLCRRVEEATGWKFDCEKVIAPGGGWVITRLS